MKYKIIVDIINEPVTLQEAKLHIRATSAEISGTTLSAEEEDGLIGGLITAAREYCEGRTRRALAEQTITAYLDNFPVGDRFELPMPPLQSVTSVIYKDYAGTETTMTVNVDYLVDSDSNIAQIVLPYGVNWPSFVPFPMNAVKVTYVAGYELNLAPKSIKQAMLLLIGHWYENREAVGNVGGKVEFAVDSLLNMRKASWF